MKFLNILILLLISNYCFCQFESEIANVLGTDKNDKPILGIQNDLLIHYPKQVNKSWKLFEVKKTNLEIDKFIYENLISFQDFIGYDEDSSNNIKKLRNLLHFVDLNKDGKLDVIFDKNVTYDDGLGVIVFLNNSKKKFDKVFKLNQSTIEAFSFKEKKLSKLFLSQHSCCDNHTTRKYIINFSFDSLNNCKILRQHFSIITNYTEEPNLKTDSIFKNPKKGKLTEFAKIRSNPIVINDFTESDKMQYFYFDRHYKNMGNSLFTVKQNETVSLLAKHIDIKNKVWFYVQVHSTSLSNDPKELEWYFENFSNIDTYGWIESRYIESINLN